MNKMLLFLVLAIPAQLMAQFSLQHYFKNSNHKQNQIQTSSQMVYTGNTTFNGSHFENLQEPQTSLWAELGYILAIETAIFGLSYAASREQRWGPNLAGGFDLFMGAAGFGNVVSAETDVVKIGYFVITTGFFIKSIYNFHWGKNNSRNARFNTNFIGLNALIFSGYYLDYLQ